MNKFRIRLAALCGAVLPFATFAEGESGGGDMAGWVTTATGKMASWAGDLAPLFEAGITIILLIVAWRLFKRTTRAAS